VPQFLIIYLRALDSGYREGENEKWKATKADPDTAGFLPSFPAAFAEVAGVFSPEPQPLQGLANSF
jgi:hypothetical protein